MLVFPVVLDLVMNDLLHRHEVVKLADDLCHVRRLFSALED